VVLRLGSLVAGVFALTALSVTNAASAQSSARVSVRWVGPASCPQPSGFEAQIAQHGDRELEEAGALDVTVRLRELSNVGSPERERTATTAYALTLELEGQGSEATREVSLESCAEAQRAAALLISTALTPALEDDREPDERPRDAPRAPKLPWSLRLAALGDLRTLPGPSGGPALGLGYSTAKLLFWGDARYLVARAFDDRVSALRADVDLFAGALGSALVWTRGTLQAGPLLELEGGVLRAAASGPRADGRVRAIWASVWAGALIRVALGARLGLGVAGSAGVPFQRPAFLLGEASVPQRVAAVSGRVLISIDVRLGSKNGADPGQ
jgi:hypothetical protein